MIDNKTECNEIGTACETCSGSGMRVYTMFHELDEPMDVEIDYSLPKLPEVFVCVKWKNNECFGRLWKSGQYDN